MHFGVVGEEVQIEANLCSCKGDRGYYFQVLNLFNKENIRQYCNCARLREKVNGPLKRVGWLVRISSYLDFLRLRSKLQSLFRLLL